MNISPIKAEAEICRRNFFFFLQTFWSEIIREAPVYNWHIKFLCEEFQKIGFSIKDRQEVNFDTIINIPPNTTKSTICSQFFPVWLWIIDPTISVITGSHSMSLATRDSLKSRDIIRSEKFKEYFPYIQIKNDNDGKTEYQNTKTGTRIAISVGGGIGRHGHVIICLPYDEEIITDIGTLKIGAIVESKIPVKVLSFNHEIKKTEYKPIIKYEKNPKRKILEIRTKSGKTLRCTEDHLIYTENKGYICASKLQEDDILITDKWNDS